MKAMIALAATLALAACPLQKSANFSTSGGGGGGSTSTAPSATSGGGNGTRAPEEGAIDHGAVGQSNLDKANFLRREFEAIPGMTVQQATAYAKERGHVGKVEIRELSEFASSCKASTVCRASSQTGDDSGMSNNDILVLHINKKLELSGPPE